MKISPINYRTNLTFGYDRKLNAEVKKELSANPNKDLGRTLLSLNSSTNKLEDLIRKETEVKTPAQDSPYFDYLDLFLSQKQALASMLSIHLPLSINYVQRELAHYEDEFIKAGSPKDDWRKDVCDVLREIIPSVEGKQEGKKSQVLNPDIREISSTSPEISSLRVSNRVKTQLSSKSFLEEFKPTTDSPRGFMDVSGMASLKKKLYNKIIKYIDNPALAQKDYEDYHKTISKSLLLYGPPGCGKTFITKALAGEANCPLYLLNISKLGSDYMNQTAKNIKSAFDEIIAIADKSPVPVILFMDEMESLGFKRSERSEPEELKQVDTMLQAMDAARAHNVIIIGATNRYDLLDPAIRRRFPTKELVDIPEKDSICILLQNNLSKMNKGKKILQSPETLQKISEMLYGYSNDSICIIIDEATDYAMERGRADVEFDDFATAIKNTSEEKPDRKEYLPSAKLNSSPMGFTY